MLLRRHNLNLLPILRELLRTRSVARTADAVGLSQSAVSAALARLRMICNDELLIMIGRRLELTEKAKRLVDQTERACLEVEALLRPTDFHPEHETRRFIVCAADYIAFLLAPQLARALVTQAPKSSVHFVEYGPDMLQQLAHGSIDVLALPSSGAKKLAASTHCAHLFSDEIVVIASTRNKDFTGELTREIYEGSPHAMFKMAGKNSTSHEASILRRADVKQRDVVLVDQFLTLPAIVEASSCLALVQRRLAERFQRSHDIQIHKVPFTTVPVQIGAYWAPSMERDPAHFWLRNLLIAAGSSL